MKCKVTVTKGIDPSNTVWNLLIGVVFTDIDVNAHSLVLGIIGCCMGSPITGSLLPFSLGSTGTNLGSNTNTSGNVRVTALPLPFLEPGCIPRLNHSIIVWISSDSVASLAAKARVKSNFLISID